MGSIAGIIGFYSIFMGMTVGLGKIAEQFGFLQALAAFSLALVGWSWLASMMDSWQERREREQRIERATTAMVRREDLPSHDGPVGLVDFVRRARRAPQAQVWDARPMGRNWWQVVAIVLGVLAVGLLLWSIGMAQAAPASQVTKAPATAVSTWVTPTSVPTRVPTAVPQGPRIYQPGQVAPIAIVANTDRIGVYLRRTPSREDKLRSWPDGTRFKTLGRMAESEGWTWVDVQDPAGNRGWVPRQYVVGAR